MKTQTESPANGGAVIEKTIRTRTIPANQQETPEFWTYLEGLQPADWSRHMLYIYRYRGEEASGMMDPLDKCGNGYLVMANGDQVPLSDREEAEFGIAAKFGGGLFRLILKRGSERVTEARMHVEAPRKVVQPLRSDSTGPTVSTMGEGSTPGDVAHHALSVMANQEKTGFEVAGAALRTSADVLARFSAAPAAAPASEMDGMFRSLMLKMMERMLAPAPDPLELLTKLITLQATLGGGNGGGDPEWAKIRAMAVEKLLNPAATGPVSSAGAELVRQLPQVAGMVTQAISEWRAGTEAQRDTAALMSGRGVPPGPGRPATGPNPQVLQPPALQPNPAPGGPPVGAPSYEFIESRVVAIMGDSATVEEAAERVVDFLSEMGPGIIEQLTGLGEAGLLNFFTTRPILKPATQNVPKLQEFIRAFLKYAGEVNGATATTEAGSKLPN